MMLFYIFLNYQILNIFRALMIRTKKVLKKNLNKNIRMILKNYIKILFESCFIGLLDNFFYFLMDLNLLTVLLFL